MKDNYIVKTSLGNYYYLYNLNGRLQGFNILKRKVKHSRSIDIIEFEGIVTYWSTGVFHSMLQLIKLPKRLFIYLLEHDKKIRRLNWVRHDVKDGGL